MPAISETRIARTVFDYKMRAMTPKALDCGDSFAALARAARIAAKESQQSKAFGVT
ncbi:MAG: hypothetical protein ABIZ56_11955 [Chthoniobacteraceae bacterium]